MLPPASLARSSTALCEMSVLRLLDWREDAFACRVMHSAVLQFSSVEVINKVGNVVGTAHLIGSHILPKPEQVCEPEKCCTLNEQDGERALLIRGSKDWGICIGKWDGFVKGVWGRLGRKGEPGKPGTRGTPGIEGQPGSLSIKFFSLSGRQE